MTLLVVAGRMALDPWWGHHHNRHLVFLPTVMIAAWLGGLGPGLLSATLCTSALAIFWNDSGESFLRSNSDLVLFALVSVATCVLVEFLHRARARADAATESREQIMAVVAHDLRNPLSVVTIAAQRLQRISGNPEPVQRGLQAIDRAASRMDHLIRDLVDATRIEHGELKVTCQPERIDTIIQEVGELFAAPAQEKGIDLVVAMPASGAVNCDRGRLLQVLGNLLGNAIKFTPEGGRVTLRSVDVGDAVRFEVEDTGPGIKPEHIGHIFERYWKADSPGTGLGLFIARSIVRAHGGELLVHSQPGRGAKFYFDITRGDAPSVNDVPRNPERVPNLPR
ncbi:MAG TPA: HAMP domain-containing sensor histidine kinase [Polyangia bacterium]|nr:HAMP domain-containing sensor histidine kinase [Polyangia bacterium]